MASLSSGHAWRFVRAGGFDQVSLETGADLKALPELDQKLWAALASPATGLEIDARTLELVDSDHDGRIRAPELLAAVKWACGLVKDADVLTRAGEALSLDAIDDSTPEGKLLLAAAKRVLAGLGRGGAASISVEDTAGASAAFAKGQLNGDGIVPPSSVEDPALKAALGDVLACIGGRTDRGGEQGAGAAEIASFFDAATAFSEWHAAAEKDRANVLPLGERTGAAHAALSAVRAKIDDYFARCRLAAFDPRTLAPLAPADAEYAAIAKGALSEDAKEIAHFPLAQPAAGRALPLGAELNPAWAARLQAFVADGVRPILGERDALPEGDWSAVKARLAAYESWLGAKAGGAAEKIGLARARELLAGDARARLEKLAADDLALEPEAGAIESVERLVRYRRDLFRLLNNFVSFGEMYGEGRNAVFLAGTLYLDGRSCELCLRVQDAGRHGALAGLSRCFLAYCDLTRKGSSEKRSIVAAFTDGDSEFLVVGRNGIFYDREGRDWDATITKVVENPIGLRQAFWAPYRKVASLVEAQVEGFAAQREKAVNESAAKGVAEGAKGIAEGAKGIAEGAKGIAEGAKGIAEGAGTGAPKPPQAFDVAKFAGIFAAIGLALGAIGGAITAVAQGFFGLPLWQMPLAVTGALLVVSGPSMLLAWMKLRQRNLGALLEANGWAVNARLAINVPFGASLTAIAQMPANAARARTDAFAERRSLKPYLVVAGVAAYIALGKFYESGAWKTWISETPAAATAIAPPSPAAPPAAPAATTGP